MNQPHAPTPHKSPNQGWSILTWLGVILFFVTSLVGVYAIIAKNDSVISLTSFMLAVVALPIGILQVKPDAFQYIWRLRRTGRLVISIIILLFSLLMNVDEFLHYHTSVFVVDTKQSTASSTLALTPTIKLRETGTTSTSCTDTEYVANFYQLVPPYPEAKAWFGWVKERGWAEEGAPHSGNILVVNANKQGAGTEGYVGIIQQPVLAAGHNIWMLVVRSTGLGGGTPVPDAHCNNIADFPLKIAAGTGDGVAFFHRQT